MKVENMWASAQPALYSALLAVCGPAGQPYTLPCTAQGPTAGGPMEGKSHGLARLGPPAVLPPAACSGRRQAAAAAVLCLCGPGFTIEGWWLSYVAMVNQVANRHCWSYFTVSRPSRISPCLQCSEPAASCFGKRNKEEGE